MGTFTEHEQRIFDHYKAQYNKFNRDSLPMIILSYIFDDYTTHIDWDDVTALAAKTPHITYKPPTGQNMYSVGRHIIEPSIIKR